MTPEIVTIEEVKAYLRIDHDDEDTTLNILIGAATEAALSLATCYDPDDEAPLSLKLAIMVHVTRAYDNREDGADTPPSAARLIHPLREMDV